MAGEFLFPELTDDVGIEVICSAISDCCRNGHIEPDGDVTSRALRLYVLGNNTAFKLSSALRVEIVKEHANEAA